MQATPRPSRADAQRNRERLLQAAVEAFSTSGIDTSLEAIAQRAGVGIGTLYRHFPSRDALALAAYQHEVQGVCAAADELRHHLPADAALREWMGRFIQFVVTKKGMGKVLEAAAARGDDLSAQSQRQIVGALGGLLERAAAAGLVRGDLEPEDVFWAMSGAWQTRGRADWQPRAARLLDLLMDGLRAGAAKPG